MDNSEFKALVKEANYIMFTSSKLKDVEKFNTDRFYILPKSGGNISDNLSLYVTIPRKYIVDLIEDYYCDLEERLKEIQEELREVFTEEDV